ncbi:MAG: YHS domain-containing protein [Phycisphaerae bacterium]
MKRFNLWMPYGLLAIIVGIVIFSNVPNDRPAMSEIARSAAHCPTCGMEVDPADAPALSRSGRTYYFCMARCKERFERGDVAIAPASSSGGRRHVDVVCHMEVNPGWGIASQYDGRTYYFCNEKCKARFDADPAAVLAEKCLVCGKTLGDRPFFAATYLTKRYVLCSEAHRAAFKQDPAAYFMHSMWGIPSRLYYFSIAIVLVVSFGVFDWISRRSSAVGQKAWSKPRSTKRVSSAQFLGAGERIVGSESGGAASALSLPILSVPLPAVARDRTQSSARAGTPRTDRFDLLSLSWVRAALTSRVFRFSLQAIVVFLFVLVVAAGLFGDQNPALNIAPILTWTIWWCLLIVLIMYAGKSWCYVCPWDAIAGWVEKLSFWKKTDVGLTLGYKWPRYVRNILIATIMFVGLTWVELGFGVTMKPRMTAYLAIGMVFFAVLSALLFDRKSFCRYGCLVGRVSGLYALFGGTEVRAKSAAVCKACQGKECVTGSASAYGCPTFLYPGKLETNTYCIQCMECIQACPEDNLAVNLRPWGSDLAIEGKPRADEAYLALLMLAITGFHGVTMTPVWQQLVSAIRSGAGVGRVLGFSLGMALLLLGPIAIYSLLVLASQKAGAELALRPLAYRDYFIRYAYAMLPIALFYHIAHNLEHLLMEGPKVVAILSDPFGWGWNVLGTADWTIPPMISLDKLWIIQVLLVLVGHVYSLWVAQKTSLRLFGSPKAAFRSQLPMLAGMICFSIFSLWLLKQPMEMRTSAM